MKTVTVKIMGKPAQAIENFSGETAGDLLKSQGLEGSYTVNIGGTPASLETELSDGAYVVFTPAVKGANN